MPRSSMPGVALNVRKTTAIHETKQAKRNAKVAKLKTAPMLKESRLSAVDASRKVPPLAAESPDQTAEVGAQEEGHGVCAPAEIGSRKHAATAR